MLSRRELLRLSMVSASGCLAVPLIKGRANASVPPTGCTLSFSTYGTPKLKTEDAIKLIAGLGFDSIEIAVQSGRDAAPAEMSTARRREIKQVLADNNLRLTSLMENIKLTQDEQQHRKDLERLRQVFALAYDLSSQPPLVQSLLGPGKWEDVKPWFRDRLADWTSLAAEAKTVIAIKPHRSHAVSRPSEAVWLFEQLGNPVSLKMAYDFSHYQYRDLTLEDTIRIALPHTAYVVVKDVSMREGNAVFELAGTTNTVNYGRLLRLFYDGGYRGDIDCEVSAMIFDRPGYDAREAASISYKNMAGAFAAAKVPRGQ